MLAAMKGVGSGSAGSGRRRRKPNSSRWPVCGALSSLTNIRKRLVRTDIKSQRLKAFSADISKAPIVSCFLDNFPTHFIM